uniref:Potassium channel tetramerization domain containing 19 n=1 Tax=Salvator merianae TaxID=96440 RepID=A0A8D0DHY1_SALMN
ENPPGRPQAERLVHLNVGGWAFAVPRGKIAQFPESLLWQAVAAADARPEAEAAPAALRLFLDRDGGTFRHVHYYLHTSRLAFASGAELPLLAEQAALLRLAPLLQTLDNLKEGKHNLRIRPADIPIAERASMNYWRTRKCISKPSEFPLKSPAFTGLHEKAPLGLIDTPLLDTEEEVHYCFLPLELLEKYPSLVNDDNLLWLTDNTVLIECESSAFRFIANFLRSEKILLPDNFSSMDVLEAEAEAMGIPEIAKAVKLYKSNPGWALLVCPPLSCDRPASVSLPLYPMVLGLLVKYPDSALGQLHMESTLDGNRIYILGNGVLFQHVMNWLGTCKLPLVRNVSELPELCAYLDQTDLIYEPMKDALKTYLHLRADWTADITVYPLSHIVKVYVGSHWYATYLQTLLKFPELLSNYKKVYWITYGQALLIHGDGQMFRHILNFLRLGKLFLPPEFQEWSLLCQEVVEYQIPSLMEALYQDDSYRYSPFILDWFKNHPPYHQRATILPIWRWESKCHSIAEDRSETCSPISAAKAAKRRSPWEGYSQSTDGWDDSCSFRQPGSPPRKRGARGSLTKQPESRETPIQKLISLVQEWDMVNCQHYRGQLGRRWSCSLPPATCPGATGPEAASQGLVIQAALRVQGNPQALREGSSSAAAVEAWVAKIGRQNLSEFLLLQLPFPPGTCPEQARSMAEELQSSTGLILRIEHPPIVACDGSCTVHESSILYTKWQLTKLSYSLPFLDVVFLSFPLSQEEIFYARKCHLFLTDIILDSIRQKDPKKTTAKVQLLVQRLWSLKISAKEFVADLLSVAPFKTDPQTCEKLLKWVEFSLPFAWKYSCCMRLLIKNGYFQSLSHFVIGKYLQKL